MSPADISGAQPSEGAVPIRDAASVLVLRRNANGSAVLMGMRGKTAAFMPSKFVFPGGAVDAEDELIRLAQPLAPLHSRRLLSQPRGPGPLIPHAIAAAALRELAEETGLLVGKPSDKPSGLASFDAAGLCPNAEPLLYMFRAITPPGRPRRFDAHFFALDAGEITGDPDDFSRACDELSHLHWVALDEARRLDLPFITEVVLAELAELAQSTDWDKPLPVPDSVPFFDNRGAEPRFVQIT
ncbi:MAG: NUDIX domain-containing protein [Paracoccus sp. (in: a-proteobacteria)]|nr:NUDIX domain-containing protein [Paracoccus sp. (in: a-proteobacteria)]